LILRIFRLLSILAIAWNRQLPPWLMRCGFFARCPKAIPGSVHRLEGPFRAWVLVNCHNFDFTQGAPFGNRTPKFQKARSASPVAGTQPNVGVLLLLNGKTGSPAILRRSPARFFCGPILAGISRMSLMQTRSLGPQSGLQVSSLGLGWGMSEFYGGRDESQAIATIRHAIDRGITLFDTADMYGIGRNEELLGRGIRDARDQLVIATKFGVVPGPDGDFLGLNGRPDCVRSACEAVCAVSVWRSSISILSAPRRPDDAY
jgi:hypothetical protein